jgi:hypothetical protein
MVCLTIADKVWNLAGGSNCLKFNCNLAPEGRSVQTVKRWTMNYTTWRNYMTTSKVLVVAALVLGFSTVSLANDAGCGLGSLVIQKNAKLSQTLAITTNASFSSQIFGITSGTSNCSSNEFVDVSNKDAAKYAEANFQNLRVDMARGKGENLSAFAQLIGCSNSSVPAFGQMARAHYQNIFPSANVTPVQMMKAVDQAVHSDAQLANTCTSAG